MLSPYNKIYRRCDNLKLFIIVCRFKSDKNFLHSLIFSGFNPDPVSQRGMLRWSVYSACIYMLHVTLKICCSTQKKTVNTRCIELLGHVGQNYKISAWSCHNSFIVQPQEQKKFKTIVNPCFNLLLKKNVVDGEKPSFRAVLPGKFEVEVKAEMTVKNLNNIDTLPT